MFGLLLIVLAGIFCLVQIFRIKNVFAKIISGFFVLAIGLNFVPIPEVSVDSYYIFGFSCMLVIFYGFITEDLTIEKRAVISTTGIIQLLGPLTIFLKLDLGTIQLAYGLSFISIGLLIFAFWRDIRQYKNEIGFLAVLFADAVTKAYYTIIYIG